MKVVVNKCFGGFGLSDKAIELIMKRKGLNCFRYKQTKYTLQDKTDEYMKYEQFNNDDLFTYYQTVDLGEVVDKLPRETEWNYRKLSRGDIDLVAVVEEIGEKEASGRHSNLKIVEIPDDIEWEIDSYDGYEKVHELHRSW